MTDEGLPLATRARWNIPNEFRYERNAVSLRAARELWEGRYPNLRFRSITNTYNCVGMVVAARRVGVSPVYLERILREDGYFRLSGPEQTEQGDVVVYQIEGDDEPTHVGIVLRKKVVLSEHEDALIVLSKWGGDGEYEHESRYVPDVYGRPTQYWTDRKNP